MMCYDVLATNLGLVTQCEDAACRPIAVARLAEGLRRKRNGHLRRRMVEILQSEMFMIERKDIKG